jgi:glutamine amidotransferase-like uncharacterized protein
MRLNFFSHLPLLLLLGFPLLIGDLEAAKPVSALTLPVGEAMGIRHPIALVYRGPAGCQRCSEAVALLLERSKWHFTVRYVGPNERLHLSATTLKSATIYAQPGGNGSLQTAYTFLEDDVHLIEQFVRSGGHYLGFCMGGYLAGATPGFHLLPGDSNEFVGSPGASVRMLADTTVRVYWRGQLRTLYFQDGPYFIIHTHKTKVTILARYTNDEIAALVAAYGKGAVGVVGPHPEATDTWYRVHHLSVPASLNWNLGDDLISTVMQE